jgi:CheY-like chemotaxis protein
MAAVTHQDPVNILLVDDQPSKLLTYESILGELGENLIKVNSATEALEYLLRQEVAVVLVDVVMPELDGYELAAMIRQHPRFQKTSIISAAMNVGQWTTSRCRWFPRSCVPRSASSLSCIARHARSSD